MGGRPMWHTPTELPALFSYGIEHLMLTYGKQGKRADITIDDALTKPIGDKSLDVLFEQSEELDYFERKFMMDEIQQTKMLPDGTIVPGY